MDINSVYPVAAFIFLNPKANWCSGNPALRSPTNLVGADRPVAKENPLMAA
jgi:hypothetical protein